VTIHSRVAGTGSYLPQKVLTNRELERLVDTTDEWVLTRTGIRQRHVAADDQNASDLALAASRKAIEAAGIPLQDIGLIIVATTTPDMIFPSTACLLQAKLGVSDLLYPDRRIAEFSKRSDILALPLAPEMQRLAESSGTYFHGFPQVGMGRGHWNPEGHRAAAGLIAKALCP